MAINIKNPETDQKIRELAALMGKSITETLDEVIEKQLIRVKQKRNQSIAQELVAIGERLRQEPCADNRSADEILGYDENGLPS